MRFRYVLLAVISLNALPSCEKEELKGSGIVITQTRQTDNFNAVSSEGTFKVIINKGQGNAVELTGEDNVLAKVVTLVTNGKLTIKYASDVRTQNHKPVSITITAPTIDKVEQNGSGSIQSSEQWSTPYFDATVKGSGSIDIYSDCDVFHGTVNGSGSLNIGGTGKTAGFTINGSGTIHSFPFTTSDATVAVEGSGKNEISVTTTLKATIKGSGKVYYKGSPIVSSTVTGSGAVVKRS